VLGLGLELGFRVEVRVSGNTFKCVFNVHSGHWRSQKFWLGGAQIGKILWRYFGDVMVVTSLKWRHIYIFEVRFRHNQLPKPLFGQITKLQIINIEG